MRQLGAYRSVVVLLIAPDDPIEGLLDLFHLGFGQILQAEQRVPRLFVDSDQFVELEMDGARVAALGALDQKNHQERDYRGSRIYDELPRIGPAEKRSGNRPYHDCGDCEPKGERASDLTLDPTGKSVENGWLRIRHVKLEGSNAVLPS